MNHLFAVPALDELCTPVLICNSKGIVIYKNPSAMRTIRLPRRNTSVRSHLRQAELSEVERIGERKKPSVLTLHTGDRPVRALVVPYVRDENCGPALSAVGGEEGEVCSLWIFPAVLQVYLSSLAGQYMESVVIDISSDICKLVKEADCLSGLLPGKKYRDLQEKTIRRINRVLAALVNLSEGQWLDYSVSMQTILPIVRRRLELLGSHLEIIEADAAQGEGLAVDFPRMAIQLLYLLTYCVILSKSRAVTLRLTPHESGIDLSASFTMNWPPYTVSETTDLSQLCQLFPGNQIDLLVLGNICKRIGKGLRWSLSDEPENNLRITADLPIKRSIDVRRSQLSEIDCLFLERDVEAIFGAVLEERLLEYGEESDG